MDFPGETDLFTSIDENEFTAAILIAVFINTLPQLRK